MKAYWLTVEIGITVLNLKAFDQAFKKSAIHVSKFWPSLGAF